MVDGFDLYQRLPISHPKEAHFYCEDVYPHLSVLSEDQSESKVCIVIHQGPMALLNILDWISSIPGVFSCVAFPNRLLIITTGIPCALLPSMGL